MSAGRDNDTTTQPTPPVSPAGKPSSLSELAKRVISAVVLAAIVLAITFVGGLAFELMCGLTAVLLYGEYCRIVDGRGPLRVAIFGALLLLVLLAAHIFKAHFIELPFLLAAVAGLALWEWIIRRSAWIALGLVYAYLPFWAMTNLRGISHEGLILVLVVFGTVWGADIAAYFTGRALGGPKLAPSISPGKTWSGFFGGLSGSVILASIVVVVAGMHPSISFFPVIMFASILSQVGDLFESKLKRVFKVKDSGTLIPGHGGILDRIDGLIFAAAFLALLGWWFGRGQGNRGGSDFIAGLGGVLFG